MQSLRQPTIALSVANGFAARFLLRSGILDRLCKENHVVLLSPNVHEEYFRAEFSRPEVRLFPLPSRPSRFQDNFERQIWQVLTPNRDGDEAVVLGLTERLASKRPLRNGVLRRLNGAMSRPAGVRALRAADRLLVRGSEIDHLFKEGRPDLVIVTSGGIEHGNLVLLRWARRRGVRTLNAVLGWDNLSTRGPMREKAQKLIVWNAVNRDEAVELHGYDHADISIDGVPHFDLYAHPESFSDWEEYCGRVGLDPGRLLITLGGTTPDTTDGFDDVVRLLAESIDSGRLIEPCQILIRPHPIVYSGWTPGQGMREHFESYGRMGSHVHCDTPTVQSEILMADLGPRDALHLAETLHHSAVMVNFFSTLMIDGAAADCPIVCANFDGLGQLPYAKSVRRFRDFESMRRVFETGAVKIADDPDQLISLINRYLAERSLESNERRALAEKYCYRLDGASAERYAERISAWARGRWDPPRHADLEDPVTQIMIQVEKGAE